MEYSILIRLILAHLLSDFILQPTSWARHKEAHGFKSKYLYWHTLITGTTAYILVPNWWLPVIIITLVHFLTDAFKGEINKRWLGTSSPTYLFVIDQIIHLLTIVIAWLIVADQFEAFKNGLVNLTGNEKLWYYLLGYSFISIPASVILNMSTQSWSEEINGTQTPGGTQQTAGGTNTTPSVNTPQSTGLKKAGTWIGIIERTLILTFVLLNQYIGIGFILAAKSVFRFGDIKENKDQKKTEYIIIGTFLSFTLALLTGIAIHFLTK